MSTPSLRACRVATPSPLQGTIDGLLRGAVIAVAAGLAGCAAGVGIGIPLVPGVSLGVGVGSGGPSIGLGTGVGPLGVGVGVNGSGQVYGGAGVGASTGIGGGARLGAGVGTGTVLYDPNAPRSSAPPPLSNRGVEQGVVVPSSAYPASPRPQPARPSGGPAQSDSPY